MLLERFDWGARQRPSVAASMRRAGSVRVQSAWLPQGCSLSKELVPADVYVSIADVVTLPRCPRSLCELPKIVDSVDRHSGIIGAPTFAGFLAAILLPIRCDGRCARAEIQRRQPCKPQMARTCGRSPSSRATRWWRRASSWAAWRTAVRCIGVWC